MIYGYIHAYKKNKHYYKQLDLMQRQKLDKIIEDTNNFHFKGSQLENLIKSLKEDDKVIVESLSTFNLPNTQLIPLLCELFDKNINIKVIDISLDSSKNKEVNVTKIINSLVKSDKLVKSRKNANTINKSKNRGKPAIDEKTINQILEMRKQNKSYTEIQNKLGISRMTISKYIKNHEGLS